MPECKNCHSSHTIKRVKVRGKQRYKCKDCGLNFVEGDGGTNEKILPLKASSSTRLASVRTTCSESYSGEIVHGLIGGFAKLAC
jgi:transposase-like protein